MSFLTDLFKFSRKAAERKSFSTQDLALLLQQGMSTKSGATVNRATALEVSAVMACVRVLGEGVAQVPFRVMQVKGKQREPAASHPLYSVLAQSPNDWMTSYEFREMMMLHAALAGNAYAYIVRTTAGVAELLPLEPGMVTVLRDGWRLQYTVTFPGGATEEVKPENMWHWKGPSWNGYVGMEAVAAAREAIGLSMVAEQQQSKSFGNGVRPSGVLSTMANMNSEQLASVKKTWEDTYAGSENAFKTVLLYGDWKWNPMSTSSADAQLLETRKYQVEEICRAFRVQPIMIGYSDKASTYASAEQMFLAHLVHTLAPWYSRLEASANRALLTPKEREAGFYTKFFAQALMRGSMAERVAYYNGMFGLGAMSSNEIRELEDMNPYEHGDDYHIPMNMAVPGEPPPAEGLAAVPGGVPSTSVGSPPEAKLRAVL